MTFLFGFLLQAGSLLGWIDAIGQKQLDQREQIVSAIQTRAQAEARQRQVRAKILRLIGGLPDRRTPLEPQVTGVIRAQGYRIEKVLFQSLPAIYVSASLYLPDGDGPFPAILHPMGHWNEGKAAAQLTAANFARKGFVVLAYDPHGQGERQQAWDARMGQSLAGGSTEQHFQDGARSILVGQTFARHRIWDGMRALDYLLTRPEVDAKRVGCTGCSGGGTLTVYLTALDERIRVAAPTCYVNTFRKLLAGPTGDSEQSLPGFLSEGLDLPDWVELAAPKPYLIGSTREDFFPLEGARMAYDEAKRWWGLFGASDFINWTVGPGPHGTPVEVREAVYAWMIRYLKQGQGDAKEETVTLVPDHELWATREGHVSGEFGAHDLSEWIATDAASRRNPGTLAELQQEIRRLMTESEPAFPVHTEWIEPQGAAKPQAVLWVETQRQPAPLAKALAAAGHRVLVVWPRGYPMEQAPRELSGDWITNTRVWLVGLNLPGLRARDILRAADLAARRPGVTSVHAYAGGLSGVWLLMAAAVEPRIASLWVDRTPPALWDAIQRPLHRDLHDAVIPGFALQWDLKDLRQAIAPRKVLWTDPGNWMRGVAPQKSADFRYRSSLQTDGVWLPLWF